MVSNKEFWDNYKNKNYLEYIRAQFKKERQSVPECARGEGNTKPHPLHTNKTVNPCKRWCFTLNNYTNVEYCAICATVSQYCECGIIGKEIGEEGTPHLQGYIEFKYKKRPKCLFGNDRIHWEKCRGTKIENIEYCRKDDKNCFYHNIDALYNVNIELYDWEKEICDIINEEPDDRKIYWYYERDGNRGKTTFCKWLFINYKDVIVISGKATDMKHGIINYMEKHNRVPKIILIDIPRSVDLQFLSYQGIEEIKNMFFFSGKYEGGMVCDKSPHLLIFSNQPPDYFKCSMDRWECKEI